MRDTLGLSLSKLDKLLIPLEDNFNALAAISIFALMLLGVVQIVGRSAFNVPIWGYIDIIELSMSLFAFMGISYCQRLGGHVRMDLGINTFEYRTQQFTEAATTAIALVLIAVMIWYGTEHAMRAWELGDSTIDAELPLWPSKAIIPVSFSLLWIRLLIQLLGHLRLALSPTLQPVGIYIPESVEELARKESMGERNLDPKTDPMTGGLSE